MPAFFRETAPARKAKDGAPHDPDAPFDLPPLGEKEIDTWLEERSEPQKKKLTKIIRGKTKEMGYLSCREGGSVWLRAQKLVVSDLIRKEIDLDEIEIS